MRISFGPFAFDPQSRLLSRDGADIALPPRVLGILELLLERAGQVVPRQDLLDRVWKDSFVTDTSLAEAVSVLRQALGDDPQAPRYIQTIHRRGYRLLVTPTTDPGVKPGSNQGQTGVRPGSDQGQTPFSQTFAPRAAVDWTLVPWSLALLCAGLAIAAVWHGARQEAPRPEAIVRYEVRAAAGTRFDDDPHAIAVSPDGDTLAWSACDTTTARCRIYLRAGNRLEAQPIAGTDEGHSPVFSPDGRWIAFFADGVLKKIAISGGAASTLASAPLPGGVAWGADGRLAFAPSAASGIAVVDDQGGSVQALTLPQANRGELRHHDPAWLEGRGLIFTSSFMPDLDAPGELSVLTSGANAVRALRSGVRRAVPADGGYLLLATASDLQATIFDTRGLALTGSSDVVPGARPGGVLPFAASSRTLAFVRAPGGAERIWSDGADASALASMTSIAIARDGRRAAGVIEEGGQTDIWIADLSSGAKTRVTFGGSNVSPAWSPDGARLFFATRSGREPFHVVSIAPDSHLNASTPVAAAPAEAFPSSVAAGGSVALTLYKDGRTSVAVVAPNGATRVLTDGPFDEANASFSPDGRYLALVSTASGRPQILLRSLTDGRRAQLSSDDTTGVWWSDDGRALYITSGRRVLKAAVTVGEDLRVSKPLTVLDASDQRPLAGTATGRILVDRQPLPDTAIVVLHWLAEMRERLPLPVKTPR